MTENQDYPCPICGWIDGEHHEQCDHDEQYIMTMMVFLMEDGNTIPYWLELQDNPDKKIEQLEDN